MAEAAVIFKPATRQAVSLIIGLAGASGSGKSFSAMRLATGLSGGKRFAVIDTEAGRALHYADRFHFDHADLHPPFTPQSYQDAIEAADKAGYPVIVVDSASHEWAGDGGVLDMQEAELDRMAGNDYRKREACKMAAWIKPKGAHKKMVSKLLQVRAHLILSFRAEEKVEMVKGDDGKTKIVPKRSTTGLDGWMPVCEKSLPFEMTVSFLLTADAPGMPKPIKLQEQHKPYFDAKQPIDEKAGARLAEWAAGSDAKPEPPKAARPPVEAQAPTSPEAPPTGEPVGLMQLVDAYAACKDSDALEALEGRRTFLWDTLGRGDKLRLKNAADAARARMAGQ